MLPYIFLMVGTVMAAGETHVRTAAETAALVEKLRAEYVWPSGEDAAGGVDEDQFCAVNKLA